VGRLGVPVDEKAVDFITAQKATALIDLGGGDTMLRRLASEVPDLVAIYMPGPRPDDLAPLATLERPISSRR
jgi:hypothetical protein